jgi:hypothetical protein
MSTCIGILLLLSAGAQLVLGQPLQRVVRPTRLFASTPVEPSYNITLAFEEAPDATGHHYWASVQYEMVGLLSHSQHGISSLSAQREPTIVVSDHAALIETIACSTAETASLVFKSDAAFVAAQNWDMPMFAVTTGSAGRCAPRDENDEKYHPIALNRITSVE